MKLIPLSEQLKIKIDMAAMPGALSMPLVADVDWAMLASFLAAVYTAIRLLEWGVTRFIALARRLGWLRSPKSGGDGPQSADG